MTNLLMRALAVLVLVTGLAACEASGPPFAPSGDAPGDMPD